MRLRLRLGLVFKFTFPWKGEKMKIFIPLEVAVCGEEISSAYMGTYQVTPSPSIYLSFLQGVCDTKHT